MTRDYTCCEVTGRAARPYLDRVGYDSFCIGALSGCSHGLNCGFAFSKRFGVELYSQVIHGQITR